MIKYLIRTGISMITMLLMVSCTNNKSQQPQGPTPGIPVAVYTVQADSAVYFDEYPATVTALNEVALRAQVSGYVTGIYFNDGQHVSKGQKLYTIDQQQYKADYDQSLANLNVAEANLAKAQQDADRYTDLAKKDAIAKQTLDHALADLQSAKMQVQAAKANVTSVQTSVGYTTIYSPLNGTIGISQVKLGAVVTPGQTLLNTVSSDDPMAVDFAIDEKQIPHFSKLLQNPAPEKDSIFSLELSDGSVYNIPGRLAFLDRAVDPLTGTIKTRLVFPNPGNLLREGMNCNVRVKNLNPASTLLIPYSSVTEQMGEYFVFRLIDKNVDSTKVVQQKVSLGQQINDMVIVKDGLSLGDEIVSEGMQKLRDSSAVKIAPSGGTKK